MLSNKKKYQYFPRTVNQYFALAPAGAMFRYMLMK